MGPILSILKVKYIIKYLSFKFKYKILHSLGKQVMKLFKGVIL